jgi:hypothetical protein
MSSIYAYMDQDEDKQYDDEAAEDELDGFHTDDEDEEADDELSADDSGYEEEERF